MGPDDRYLHGYSRNEQDRLYRQAAQLEQYIYPDINLQRVEHLLEVGCGVGAQTKILIRRFPNIKITAVDRSQPQLDRAREYLANEITREQVELVQADATQLPRVLNRKYDAAFLCWFLEHVPDPLAVLRAVRKSLQPEAYVWITEVNNADFFIDPYSPGILKYWFEMNDLQWSIQGHPFIGAQLGNYLLRAGFTDIQTELRDFFFDARDPDERNKFIKSFYELMMSAKQSLLDDHRLSENLIDQVSEEFDNIISDPYSLIQMGWTRGVGKA